jgi:hypothetical protein
MGDAADYVAAATVLALGGWMLISVAPVIVAIAIQAVVASQLGLALRAVGSERFRQHAEQGAGLAPMALGGYLIAERAIG